MVEIRQGEEINGRYVLKESIGRGTFGQVWLAHDRAKDEDVAIKFYVALDNKGREEFIQEYRIAAGLEHPNLLVTKDFGVWQDHPWLTMRFCDSGSAGDIVGKLRPTLKDELTIWRFIHDVAAGLAYLHHVKPEPIVHQDIKPDNVLIASDGTFLITDFGISKRIRNTISKQSTRALKAGAPAYMGPERFSDNPEPVFASDVWSLGVSIYELAEGELPFSGMGGMMMNKGVEIPMLSSGWSENLNDIMRWCLEKETWDRARADQVAEIAKAVLDFQGKVCVESLIMDMKRNASSTVKGEKINPKATNPYVRGTDKAQSESKQEENIEVDNSECIVSKDWWQKPSSWIIVTFVLTLVVFFVWNGTREEQTKDIISPIVKKTTPTDAQDTTPKVVKAQDEKDVIVAPEKKKVTVAPEKKKSESLKKSIPEENDPLTNVVRQGVLSLGYATWKGNIKRGKPDGKGIMTFSSSHRIDSRDSKGRIAEAGDKVEGSYLNGHLSFGKWYKSDGTTETIMIGE
ncbi:serine/threonine protein kinase [Prevotella sp.]|uniref:serine/threonine protein kinase n=1 Tax=Prevotella sp. TaxID=59823 RepID=UPI003AB33BB3